MKHRLARRVHEVEQSDIRRFSILCAQVGGVNLGQGVCDQPAPDTLKRAVIDAVDADHATYTHLRGIAPLRRAIAEKLARFNGISADPETEIAVTVGCAGAYACACMALLNPGDEVISFSPYYSYHSNMCAVIDCPVRYVDLVPPDWHFSVEQLRAAVTDRTRFILVNTPSNPSGKVFTRAELDQIARVCIEHDLLAVTDEIYEYITYDLPHVSLAALPGMRERTITISGASKTYAVTGHRVGYAAGPAPIIEKLAVLHDILYICAPAPLQHGVAAALALPDSYYSDMAAEYRRKRDLLSETLSQIGFTPYTPQGAYYTLADVSSAGFDSATQAAETLLERVGVAAVPGTAFFRDRAEGQHLLRFCYAKQMPDLQEACRRLQSFVR